MNFYLNIIPSPIITISKGKCNDVSKYIDLRGGEANGDYYTPYMDIFI